jgi:hypothetical protein
MNYVEVEVVDENVKDNSVTATNMWDSNTPSSKKPVGMLGSIKGMSPSVGQRSVGEHQHGDNARVGGGVAVAPRISLVLLSSPESGGSNGHPRPSSKGIRRCTSSAHTVLAESTKAIGDVMVAQMKELVGAARESETNCLGIHLKLFAEKMEY